ncbi:HAD-IA family hydrolase [Kitasatospora sp. NPDC093558]|uniref:HAD family hydrolase n=1 Tax=Kitasatospora sp. NPDC093558 TaxID=3155201 RepID=UPI00341F9BE8
MDERCIILDIGGVLEYTPRTGWLPYWERELGLTPGTVDQRLEDVWHAGSIGAIDEAEVRRQVAARLRLDPPRVEAFMADFWTEHLGTPNDELIAHVRGLRGRARLGILSNSFAGAREREVGRYGFGELVETPEHIVYSHETGIEKPDPQAFERACTVLGVHPADCLFVDDHAPNVETALALGMQAHLFDDNARTIARIAEFLTTGSEFRN